MRRDVVLSVGLGVLAAVLIVARSGGAPWRSFASAAFVTSAIAAALWAPARWRPLGTGAMVLGIALAPSASSFATDPLAIVPVLAALFGVGVALWGVPPRAWLPGTLLSGLALTLAVLPSVAAPGLVGLDAAPFLLLVAAVVGAPCAIVAFVKRERHLELIG